MSGPLEPQQGGPPRPAASGEPGTQRERWLLRLGEFLVRIASRRLPRRVRDERYREWTAELPVILHDPDGGTWPQRAARMIGYALDTIRGTAAMPRRRAASRGGIPWPAAGLVPVGLYIYFKATAGDGFGVWLTVLFTAGMNLAVYAIQWRRKTVRRGPGPGFWFTAGTVITAAGYTVLKAAQDNHWRGGALHAVTLASHCTAWVGTGFFVISAVAAVRLGIQRRAARRDAGQPTR